MTAYSFKFEYAVILSLFFLNGEPDLTVVGIVDFFVSLFKGPVDDADLRSGAQLVAGGGEPLGDGSSPQIIHQRGGEHTPPRLADQVLSRGDGDMFKLLCHLAQILIEVFQRPFGQTVGVEEIIAIGTEVRQDLIDDLMLPGHTLQNVLVQPGGHGEIVILIPFFVGIPGEALLVARQEHCGLLFNAIVHNTATFQSNFDGQAGEGFQARTVPARQ